MADDLGDFKVVTLAERPGLDREFSPQKARIWPQYMFHDRYSDSLWHYTFESFPEYQLYLLNPSEEPIAVAQSMPMVWDGSLADLPLGWYDILVRATSGYEAGRAPNTLSPLEIAIQPEYRGHGVSYRLINALRNLAVSREFHAMLVAVRPSEKSDYPITPMERYVRWKRSDGSPFDLWLRAHWRSGGEILTVAHPSMIIEGRIEQWEEWTGLEFPESGDYVVPGALVPVQVDREMNLVRYVEPNVWVHHPITTIRLSSEPPGGRA
jgi:GNAT superfamily N-acetyltransferase